jgi:signal transduction histidine kinase/ActR/RegA family two-component response regulator
MLSLKFRMLGVAAMDTTAICAVFALTFFDRMSVSIRAACTCFVMYVLGAGLMMSVGSIGQTYLFAFSIMATLLLSVRWGLAASALNAATMLAIGLLRVASPEMTVSGWKWGFAGWLVITSNFVLVNICLVVAVGAVIRVVENAARRAVESRKALEIESKALLGVNESLVESKALLRIAGRTARLGGWRVALGGTHVGWSDEVCEIHEVPIGTSPTLEEAIAFYAPEWRSVVGDAVATCARDGTPFDTEAEIITSRGNRLWIRAIGNALRNADGTISHVHGSVQDISPQKLADAKNTKLAEQLRQAQKMETIGSLAGGVAHDFNNLLTIILSYGDLIADQLKVDDPVRTDLEEIRNAGVRAADLTRQLLAFSRQQVLAPKIVELGDIVGGMEKMLRRLIGEDVALSVVCPRNLAKVLVDPGQMEQVIMNLAVNARDAMPRGGMLTIETAEVVLDEAYASTHVGVKPGPHVMLAVSDTGTGIDKATQDRMFEPFFTTKKDGQGTGLGLATVFGIVRQSGGTVWVYSELGKGTTFKIYLPMADRTTVAMTSRPPAESASLFGSETILLVEDEERVRAVTRAILRKYGYNVLEAQGGGDAFLLCEQHTAPIHLLLTDVVMPRMSGRQLAERLLPSRPEMKVLYMSGYTDDAVVRHGILDSSISFIQKPLTPLTLARKIRDALDAKPLPQ